jgi:transcriptional regulator with XRE-family HTH domain
MKHKVNLPIPVTRALRKMGKDVSDARRRRLITIELMAERAGVSRATISKIELGSSTTSIGAYAAVLFVLGMAERLGDLVDAAHDITGRLLFDEKLPQRVRLPSKRKSGGGHE